MFTYELPCGVGARERPLDNRDLCDHHLTRSGSVWTRKTKDFWNRADHTEVSPHARGRVFPMSFAAKVEESMAQKLNDHPLMFTFRDAISGEGFLAGITLSGRCLMAEEDGKWWMYGVRPGAIAEVGKTPEETFLLFRNRYKEVLFDVASECKTFDDFKKEVERFFYEPDTVEEKRWEDAVACIRLGNLVPPPPFDSLPKIEPERRPTQITVERLDGVSKRFMPSDNVPDTYLVPLAA